MSNKTHVYSIVTLGMKDKSERISEEDVIRTRCVGIFNDKELAVRIVETNTGDLVEAGYYQWAVVEPVDFGLYPTLFDKSDCVWFRWVGKDDGQWVKSDGAPQDVDKLIETVMGRCYNECSVPVVGAHIG